MIYWDEEGLREPQAKNWCIEFEITPEDLRQQLAWARWDILENDRKVESPLNWFYGVLKKTAGCYPPAKGYQSPAMIRAARMAAQYEAEQQAREKLSELERNRVFADILAEPTGAAYQSLLSEVDDFAKGQGGKTLERALKAIYLKRSEG